MNKKAEAPMCSLKLSPRGREVFQLLMEGVAVKKIGELLGISYSGVRRHKEKMLTENDCKTVQELVAKSHFRTEDVVQE